MVMETLCGKDEYILRIAKQIPIFFFGGGGEQAICFNLYNS